MSEHTLPFDIQYLILEKLSHIDRSKGTWLTILNYFCVSRQWHTSLQELLIQNNAAYTLLETSPHIGHIAVEKAVTRYETWGDTADTYLLDQQDYSLTKDGLAQDLGACMRSACYSGFLPILQSCLVAGIPYN
ncbi:hypothetical protein BDW62DRAFT_202750 [Aspergillus aurantiobrunneus]